MELGEEGGGRKRKEESQSSFLPTSTSSQSPVERLSFYQVEGRRDEKIELLKVDLFLEKRQSRTEAFMAFSGNFQCLVRFHLLWRDVVHILSC